MEVSVILPAFNESGVIQQRLRGILTFAGQRFERFEIIVVDDGSSDETAVRVREIAAAEPRVALISYPENRGKGYAVRLGISKASMPHTLLIDSDLDVPVDGLELFLDHVITGAITVASKAHAKSQVLNWTRRRRLLSKAFQRLIVARFGLPVRDTQVGLKWLPTASVQPLLGACMIDRFAFDLELLAFAHRAGIPLHEAPVIIRFQPERDNIRLRDMFEIYQDSMALRGRLRAEGR